MKLYYTAPSDEIFEQIKQAALKTWSKYNDDYGYRTEKISRVKSITNVADNWMYLVAMFDWNNQREMMSYLPYEIVSLIEQAIEETS